MTQIAPADGAELFHGDANDVVERAYATEDVRATRAHMTAALQLAAGERVLEIGCGAGYHTVDIARAIGPTGRLEAIDISDDMVDRARARCARAGLGNVQCEVGDGGCLRAADATYDAAVAAQVLQYVRAPETVIAECRRVLKPGGRALFLDIDWGSLAWHSSDPERMHRVLAAGNSFRPDPLIVRRMPGLLRDAGLELELAAAFPTVNTTIEDTQLSRWMMEFFRVSALKSGRIPAAEVDAWAADLRRLSAVGDYYYCVNRCCFVARKPA